MTRYRRGILLSSINRAVDYLSERLRLCRRSLKSKIQKDVVSSRHQISNSLLGSARLLHEKQLQREPNDFSYH